MPVLSGRWARSWLKAFRPPAEAPIPTTGKGLLPVLSSPNCSAAPPAPEIASSSSGSVTLIGGLPQTHAPMLPRPFSAVTHERSLGEKAGKLELSPARAGWGILSAVPGEESFSLMRQRRRSTHRVRSSSIGHDVTPGMKPRDRHVQPGQQFLNVRRLDRVDQVVAETGLQRAVLVLLPPPGPPTSLRQVPRQPDASRRCNSFGSTGFVRWRSKPDALARSRSSGWP